MLLTRCIELFRGLSKRAKDGFEKEIIRLLRDNTFDRYVIITDLCEADNAFTSTWCQTMPYIGAQPRNVRCGLPFDAAIAVEAPPNQVGRDPSETMFRLLRLCVPCARTIFTGTNAPLRLLHINDYSMEKTFVYAIVSLSKWCGAAVFPYGVYGQWPPPPPVDLDAQMARSQGAGADGPQPSVSPPLPPPAAAPAERQSHNTSRGPTAR